MGKHASRLGISDGVYDFTQLASYGMRAKAYLVCKSLVAVNSPSKVLLTNDRNCDSRSAISRPVG